MRFLSVCSGIEAASVAWQPLGWTPAAYSEIDAFPSAVLAHHHPDVPNLGDMTKFKDWPDATIDVLVGGTPCQSFSVAGLRRGIADPRGNLALTYLAIADRYRPDWLVWENVPGVLSSGSGDDLAAFLGGLGQLGYGWAYRVFDAQYFGLAQRRRRVFVVASARGWQRAAAVLFEPESLRGDPAPMRDAGQSVAPTIAARTRGGGGLGTDADVGGALICMSSGQAGAEISIDKGPTLTCLHEAPIVARTLKATNGGVDREDGHTLVAFNARQDPLVSGYVAGALDSQRPQAQAMIFKPSHFTRGKDGAPSQLVPALSADADKGDQDPLVLDGWMVRRLTPRECERLQGFPDDYTLVPYGKALAADTPRYKALGNSMAVPVIRWLGRRIALIESLALEAA